MRQQLIMPSPEGTRESNLRRRFGRLRGGAGEDDMIGTCGGCCCVMIFLCWGFMISGLAPNEYGLLRNYLTGSIEFTVYRGGIHLTGPLKGFMKFPASQVTLEFSADSGRMPVQARTGAAPDDAASGGQPISIACAVQYEFHTSTLKDVYLSFGSYEAATERFYQLTKMAVSSTAQDFTPQDFWEHRRRISAEMLNQVNSSLWSNGHVTALRFEILKVGFQKKYEDSITNIQVAEQQKVVNENEQKVQEVIQSINVMNSANQAHISNVSAGADADSKQMVAKAKKDAFLMTQNAKANNYALLKHELEFTDEQLREYFKIKAVQATGKFGKVVVGMSNPGSAVGHEEL